MRAHPRVVAHSLFLRRGRVLLIETADPATGKRFLRPLGGGVEFGERGDIALAREVEEETGERIHRTKFLGVLENLFVYDDVPGHEIVLVYGAEFERDSVYGAERVPVKNQDGLRMARWFDADDLPNGADVVPRGILKVALAG
ncbi:MAG: NUDIX domain-containing protein [Methanobacteriota archaeon]